MNAIRYATKEHVLNDICRIDKELKAWMERRTLRWRALIPTAGRRAVCDEEVIKSFCH
ncbi:hypothetical protein [Enterocloster sp.]|uniref:hypothetical protein n=1 Tax=Enterocloster sp. TaxID=2719315 RepID=UPI00399FD6F6